VRGRTVGRHCVAPTRLRTHARACRLKVVRATLSLAAHQGRSSVRFQGVLARRRRLKPGTYTVAITAAIAGARRSHPSSLTFTIVGRVR
jgi:hypothetical protein